MNTEELEEKTRTAIDAYNDYVDIDKEVLANDLFIRTFVEKTITAKEDLKNMLRKHPNWDEKEECIVQKIMVKKKMNYVYIQQLLLKFLCGNGLMEISEESFIGLLNFFSCEENDDYKKEFAEYAGKAYKDGRKKSRILRNLAQIKGWDKVEGFDKWFAEISNELNVKPRKISLIVSVNPTHFLTMSNPHGDTRGEMLTSCHSLNAEGEYKNGCVGYARDNITMIAFTVNNINDKKSWYNRKTSRQLFMYEPGSGVLLQSRMYNANGGTTGQQIESESYRKAVQTIIATCENTPNEWDCESYVDNTKNIIFEEDCDFGGYADWYHRKFAATISTQKGYSKTIFSVGEAGLCFGCGKDIMFGLYCMDCDGDIKVCDACGNYMTEANAYTAYRNGEELTICSHCEESEAFVYCDHCDTLIAAEDSVSVNNQYGYHDYFCKHCFEELEDYQICPDCGEAFHKDDLNEVYDEQGNIKYVCDDCLESYSFCKHCKQWYPAGSFLMKKGQYHCPDCAKK